MSHSHVLSQVPRPAQHFSQNMKCLQPFSKQQIFDSSKVKQLADDNFKFDENGRKSFKWIENTVEKVEIAHYEQFLLFPQCFQKTCTANT